MMTKKDKKNHWDFLTQLLGSEETSEPSEENLSEECEEGDVQEKIPEVLTMEETFPCQEKQEERMMKKGYFAEGIFTVEECCSTEAVEMPEPQVTEKTAEERKLPEEPVPFQPALMVEEIEEEGYVFKKIPTIQRPQGGFGAGILEELFPEESFEEAEREEKTECLEVQTEECPQEPELPVSADALDPWALLAMDLGLPVTLPPEKPEKKTPEKKREPVQGEVESLTQKIEKEDSGMEKNDWQREPSKGRGKKMSRKAKDVAEAELAEPSAAKPREKRRKERVGKEISEKPIPVEEKRKGKKNRLQETYSEEVDYPTDIPGYESAEARRRMRELFPVPIMEEEEVDEFPGEEERYPNAARSRRRRRVKRESEDFLAEAAPETPEEDREVSRPPRSRKRKERFWESQEIHDELPTEDPWSGYDDEEDEDEEVPVPKRRRNRRDSRPYRKDERSLPEEDSFVEDEDHVFEEIEEPVEEEDDDEDELDLGTLNVPGWRDTINIIVNTNLSARNREPSSLVGNIKAKRRQKRRS